MTELWAAGLSILEARRRECGRQEQEIRRDRCHEGSVEVRIRMSPVVDLGKIYFHGMIGVKPMARLWREGEVW